MTVVSNTSPISNLAAVGQLNLLQQIYRTLLIPIAVYEELMDERAGETVIATVRAATWIEVRSVKNQELVNRLRNRVNVGEAEAIALAIEVNATRLLIDERLGRQAASDLGLRIIGVLGILLSAKRQELITAVKPIVNDLVIQASFRISSQLLADILNAADEINDS